MTDRAEQDAAIQAARRAGHVSGSALEGRHGNTPEEIAAAHGKGDERIGFLSARRPERFAEDASGHEHKGKGEGGGQFTAAASAMKAAHPHPGVAPPEAVHTPDQAAQRMRGRKPVLAPEQEAAQRKWEEYQDQSGRAYIAATIHRVLTRPAAPAAQTVKGAIRRVGEEADDLGYLGPDLREHQRVVTAAHPEGEKALAAARAEQRRRYEAAVEVAGRLIAQSPPGVRGKAHRALEKAKVEESFSESAFVALVERFDEHFERLHPRGEGGEFTHGPEGQEKLEALHAHHEALKARYQDPALASYQKSALRKRIDLAKAALERAGKPPPERKKTPLERFNLAKAGGHPPERQKTQLEQVDEMLSGAKARLEQVVGKPGESHARQAVVDLEALRALMAGEPPPEQGAPQLAHEPEKPPESPSAAPAGKPPDAAQLERDESGYRNALARSKANLEAHPHSAGYERMNIREYEAKIADIQDKRKALTGSAQRDAGGNTAEATPAPASAQASPDVTSGTAASGAPTRTSEPVVGPALFGSADMVRVATPLRDRKIQEANAAYKKASADLEAKGKPETARQVRESFSRLLGNRDARHWLDRRQVSGADMLREAWKDRYGGFAESWEAFAEDASGHEHKGKGEGGGQFTKKGQGGGAGGNKGKEGKADVEPAGGVGKGKGAGKVKMAHGRYDYPKRKENPIFAPQGDATNEQLQFGLDRMAKDGSTLLPGLKYPNVQSYVRAKGRIYQSARLPDDVSYGPINQCYANAYHLVESHPELTYVEGYATVYGLPIAHAWAVTRDGTVLDPTWYNPKIAARPEEHAYFGVPIPFEQVKKTVRSRGEYGVIYNPEEGLPLLRGQ